LAKDTQKLGGKMEKIYLYDNNQTERISYENKLSGTDYDVSMVNRLPFFTLIDKNPTKRGDRRTHRRFQVKRDACALIRPVSIQQIQVSDRSMAEIACAVYRSKPIQFGRINNISMDGLSFNYIVGEEKSSSSLVLDILLADSGFYLANLKFKTVTDVKVASDLPMDPIAMRRHHVRFQRMAPDQIKKMQYLIQHYTRCGE
jgi:hypothetical protein